MMQSMTISYYLKQWLPDATFRNGWLIVALSLAHKHRHKQTSTKRKKIKGEKYKEDKPGGLRDNDNNKVLKTPSIYRSIHPFFLCSPRVGSRRQQPNQGRPDLPLPSELFQLIGGKHQGFPRPAERSNISSRSWFCPGATFQQDIPRAPQSGVAQKPSQSDVRTSSTGSFRCGSAVALI